MSNNSTARTEAQENQQRSLSLSLIASEFIPFQLQRQVRKGPQNKKSLACWREHPQHQFCVRFATKLLVTINHVSKGAKSCCSLIIHWWRERKKINSSQRATRTRLVIFVCLFINQTGLLLNFVHTGVVGALEAFLSSAMPIETTPGDNYKRTLGGRNLIGALP